MAPPNGRSTSKVSAGLGYEHRWPLPHGGKRQAHKMRYQLVESGT